MTPSAFSPASSHDIIVEILRNMKDGLELLYDTVIPPAVYRVYLHRDDLNRIRGILPRIVDEARQALSAEIGKLNQGTLSQKLRISRPRLIVESLGTDWIIEFLENADEETQPGDIVIYSELALPPQTRLLRQSDKANRYKTPRKGHRNLAEPLRSNWGWDRDIRHHRV